MADPITKFGGLVPWTTNIKIGSSDLTKVGKIAQQTVFAVWARMFRNSMSVDPQSGFWGDDCLATATATLQVTIGKGVGFYYDSSESDAHLNDYKPIVLGADVVQAIDAHDATNPRIDRIVLAPNTTDDEAASRNVKDPSSGAVSSTSVYLRRANTYTLTYVVGTPAGSPSAPAIPAGSIACCQVNVPATSGAVTVTDERTVLSAALDSVPSDFTVGNDLTVANDATITGDLTVGDVTVGSGKDHKWSADRSFQTAVDMQALASLVEHGMITGVAGSAGTWTARQGDQDVADIDGDDHGLSWVQLVTGVANDYIAIDISAEMRAGATLEDVLIVAEADTGDIDLSVDVEELAWAGTGTSWTSLGDDTVNIGNTGRKLVTANVSAATKGAAAAGGQKFYRLKLLVDALNSSAADLAIYGIAFRWTTTTAQRAIGSYSAI